MTAPAVRHVLGVDLGLSGGLALLDHQGAVRWVQRMPILCLPIGRSIRKAYDRSALASILEMAQPGTLVVEDIYHMGFRGSLAARAAGVGWGMMALWAACERVRFMSVAPRVWQRELLSGRRVGRGALRARAKELFPAVDLAYDASEGMSAALLLAEYGRRRL